MFCLSFWLHDSLPRQGEIHPALSQAPVVNPTEVRPFTTKVGEFNYLIEPVREYELYGLVVSKHNARGWRGQIHKEIGDHINVADLCVVWGSNAIQGYYQNASFSSAQFTCYANWGREKFEQTLLSNNHMLSDSSQITRQLHNIKIGDQIHVKGYLANYSKFQRSRLQKIRDTDLTIGNSGNTACETFYATQVTVLKENHNIWQYLYWLSLAGIIGSIIGWFCIPLRHHTN